MFLKPLAPLFKAGPDKVDWKAVEQSLKNNLHQFFMDTDFAKYASPNEIQIFVVARDKKKGTKLGVIQFQVAPQFNYGTVRVGFFGIISSAENGGIERLLLASIFKLIPDTSRIFLHARVTNEKVLNNYQDLGFIKFEGPLTFWTDMEYLINKSVVLQRLAESFK